MLRIAACLTQDHDPALVGVAVAILLIAATAAAPQAANKEGVLAA